VAMEAAAEMIVDAALCHLVERQPGHLQRLFVVESLPDAQQNTKLGRMGKLRCHAEAAVDVVKAARQLPDNRLQRRRARFALAADTFRRLADELRDVLAL